jgi:hypothetical protein
MDDVGFWKKKGCFGRALLSSVMWSLDASQLQDTLKTHPTNERWDGVTHA